MADISEAMVEALQAAHNLIANTAFDAGEAHQWAVAVDEKIQAALALSAAPASAQMEELSRLREERDEAIEALAPFAREADAISKAHLDGHVSDLDMRPVAVGLLRHASDVVRALKESLPTAGGEK